MKIISICLSVLLSTALAATLVLASEAPKRAGSSDSSSSARSRRKLAYGIRYKRGRDYSLFLSARSSSGSWEFEKEKRKTGTGLSCMAGGMTTSLLCASVMRAFQKQTITVDGEDTPALEVFDFMSGASGGNPPIAIYVFAQNTNSDELLEVDSLTRNPSEITMEMLEVKPDDKSIFKPWVTPEAPAFVMGLFDAYFSGSAVWEKTAYYLMLREYGIPEGQLITDLKMRSDVKATPIFGMSMVGPAELYKNDWFENVIKPLFRSSEFLGSLTSTFQVINGGFIDKFNETLPLLMQLAGGEDERRLSPNADIPDSDKTFFMVNVTSLMDATKRYGFKARPIPAFATDQEFHIPFTPPGGKGTMLFDGGPGLTADPIDFEGPLTVSYEEASSGSDPITLEKMLGAATDNVGIRPFYRALINGIIEGLGDVPVTIDIPYDTKRKMSITGKFSCLCLELRCMHVLKQRKL